MGSGSSMDFPLDDLPDEVLVVILSFCPDQFLIRKACLVCKKWKDICNGQTLWRLKCDRSGVTIPDTLPLEYRDYKRLCLRNVFGRNLLKNWDASKGLDHWSHNTQSYHRQAGIKIENSIPSESCGSDPISELNLGTTKCWAFTYWLETMEQKIDLIKEGMTPEILDNLQPGITVSAWTAARFDCASKFMLIVTLHGENGKVLGETKHVFEEERVVPQWDDHSWVKISHTFCDYGTGVRQVAFMVGGTDKQFWAGNFGPKVAAPCVKIELQ